MVYTTHYSSPIGNILLAARNDALIGLWIDGQKYFFGSLDEPIKEHSSLHVLLKTKDWLDRYFAGEKPEINELKLNPIGSEFRKATWDILCQIPYGKIISYKEVAQRVAAKLGRERMSAQAVGGAVGHNQISIIIPCHRVVGSNGNLTGYAGGLDKKIKLLTHEGIDMAKLFVPANSKAF